MSLVKRLSRRRFIALITTLPLAAALAGEDRRALASLRPERAVGAEIRNQTLSVTTEDVVGGYADGIAVGSGRLVNEVGRNGLALSRVFSAPFPFLAVAIHWVGDSGPAVALRTSADGTGWSDWRTVGREVGRDIADGVNHSTLVFPPDGKRHSFVQTRLVVSPEGTAKAQMSTFSLTFIDPGETPLQFSELMTTTDQATLADLMAAKPAVVSRAGWGCPNPAGDMTDSSGALLWPKEYYTVSHLILHHTDTSNTATDWPAVVRAVWNYHAVTLGWGDVGYNFMIDPNGQIYEGRAGANDPGHSDDDVEAGHVYSYNRHTCGIAILGTYETVSPPAVALTACERLMAWKCSQRGLDPQGSGGIQRACDNAWITMPRIAGHTDYGWYDPAICPGYPKPNSSCPGATLESRLPEIRQQAAGMTASVGAQVTSVSISPSLVGVGSTVRATVTIKNTGSAVLSAGSPANTYTYTEGQVAGAQDGVLRIGLDYEGRPSSQPRYPYRWGLGSDLAPGESRTVTLAVTLNTESTHKYWVGLIYERDQVLADHLGETTVNARQKRFSGDVGIDYIKIGPSLVFTGSVLQVSAEVQNWGSTVAQTQGPPPGYVYQEGETCSDGTIYTYRIGVDYDGRTTALDHPYRWGFGDPLPGGSVRQVTGYVRMRAANSTPRTFWVNFVQEKVAWLQTVTTSANSVEVVVQVPKARVTLPLVRR